MSEDVMDIRHLEDQSVEGRTVLKWAFGNTF
jgi:hypothetical protein